MIDYGFQTPEDFRNWQANTRRVASYAYTRNFLRSLCYLGVLSFADKWHITTHNIPALEKDLC
jgi:hypothetical protein